MAHNKDIKELEKAARENASHLKGIDFVNSVFDFKAGAEWAALQLKEAKYAELEAKYKKVLLENSEMLRRQLQSIEDGWISVEDRLPVKGQKVIAIQDPLTTATKEPVFAIFNGKDFIPPSHTVFADFEVAQSKWIDIILWQPLPLPPKK